MFFWFVPQARHRSRGLGQPRDGKLSLHVGGFPGFARPSLGRGGIHERFVAVPLGVSIDMVLSIETVLTFENGTYLVGTNCMEIWALDSFCGHQLGFS